MWLGQGCSLRRAITGQPKQSWRRRKKRKTNPANEHETHKGGYEPKGFFSTKMMFVEFQGDVKGSKF